MASLLLVRHGRPAFDFARPAASWPLDPAFEGDVVALAHSGRIPGNAVWYTSPEPKASRTAELLAGSPVCVAQDLHEHRRDLPGRLPDFADAVAEAFARPEESVRPGWEPLATARRRVSAAVRRILEDHPDDDVVLVGHGTAWALLIAELKGGDPDPARWRALAMPDVITIPRDHLV